MHPTWKPDWEATRQQLVRWWRHEGLAVPLIAPRSPALENIPPLAPTADLLEYWTGPDYRAAAAEATLARHVYLGEAFPYFDTHIGPGSLSLVLGSEPHFDWETVWYQRCITDPDTCAPLAPRLDETNHWWQVQRAIVEAGLARARGRYLVGMPDLVEGLDTLAALRGNMETLYDLIERPGWVCERLAEINQAWFAVFGALYERIRDEYHGNAFCAFLIWGPGKTAKLQCDFSAMISPKMFARFVTPYLTEQCRWLDFSMYHLDGTNARQHLDALLAIPELDAIEWTPQAGKPGGGSPDWWPMYRRILAAGKSVQAVGVTLPEVIPLLDAVGPRGMFLILDDPYTLAEAEDLRKRLEPYYAA